MMELAEYYHYVNVYYKAVEMLVFVGCYCSGNGAYWEQVMMEADECFCLVSEARWMGVMVEHVDCYRYVNGAH